MGAWGAAILALSMLQKKYFSGFEVIGRQFESGALPVSVPIPAK